MESDETDGTTASVLGARHSEEPEDVDEDPGRR
jgi:hypothetical protein